MFAGGDRKLSDRHEHSRQIGHSGRLGIGPHETSLAGANGTTVALIGRLRPYARRRLESQFLKRQCRMASGVAAAAGAVWAVSHDPADRDASGTAGTV